MFRVEKRADRAIRTTIRSQAHGRSGTIVDTDRARMCFHHPERIGERIPRLEERRTLSELEPCRVKSDEQRREHMSGKYSFSTSGYPCASRTGIDVRPMEWRGRIPPAPLNCFDHEKAYLRSGAKLERLASRLDGNWRIIRASIAGRARRHASKGHTGGLRSATTAGVYPPTGRLRRPSAGVLQRQTHLRDREDDAPLECQLRTSSRLDQPVCRRIRTQQGRGWAMQGPNFRQKDGMQQRVRQPGVEQPKPVPTFQNLRSADLRPAFASRLRARPSFSARMALPVNARNIPAPHRCTSSDPRPMQAYRRETINSTT